MAKEDILESTDNIIDLIDIVQPSDKQSRQDVEKVDFDTELSDLINSGDPISLDDIPDLDELFADDEDHKENKDSQDSIILDDDTTDELSELIDTIDLPSDNKEQKSKSSLEKTDSTPEDLDALLDNLFNDEEKGSIQSKIESKPSRENLSVDPLEISTTGEKTNFLEKALDGLDDLDELLLSDGLSPVIDVSAEQSVRASGEKASEQVKKNFDQLLNEDLEILETIHENALSSNIDEVESILTAVESETVIKENLPQLDNKDSSSSKLSQPDEDNKTQARTSKKIDISEEQQIHSPITSDNNIAEKIAQQSSISNSVKELKETIQRLEEDKQTLFQRINSLELILMDHQSEVETLQESNIERFKRIEEHNQLDKIVEEVFNKLQPDIDKAAAAAAARVIREEIAELLKK